MPFEGAQSLHHAVKILDCFSQEQPELGVREVARMAELSSSAVGRLMLSMKSLGILNQNPKSKTYSLGPRVLTWAGVYLTNSDIRTTALPYLQELHQSTQETISLYILDGSERVCIERLESPQNVRIVARLGRRLPLYAGSAGKVFLAFMKPQQCDLILARKPLVPLTSKTIVDLHALQLELENIRAQGYAVSRGEWLLDASGVAAPVYDATGEITAVLTISGPSQRFSDEVIKRYSRIVTNQAQQISLSLGYRQPRQLQPIQPTLPG
jgi:IclR family transcriptional regulator, KDG regulon repressor